MGGHRDRRKPPRARRRVHWWRVLGVAGLVGVATTGVLVARDERRRRSYTPAEVRGRLQQRLRAVERARDSQ